MIDNVTRRLVDELRDSLKAGSKVSVAAATFSMYAFGELKEELQGIDRLRFLFTSPAFLKSSARKEKKEFYIPRLNRERSLYGSEFEIRLRNELSLKAIAHECADWIRKKATFRANASDSVVPGLIHVASDSPIVYYPINGFTTTDLSRRGGTSNGQDLNRIDWGNYDLLVIDESHNFRNGGHLTDEDEEELQEEGARVNRYITPEYDAKLRQLRFDIQQR